jgi:hypothetical protein
VGEAEIRRAKKEEDKPDDKDVHRYFLKHEYLRNSIKRERTQNSERLCIARAGGMKNRRDSGSASAHRHSGAAMSRAKNASAATMTTV